MVKAFKYFLAIFLILEVGTRLTRISDFPLYEANNKIGYIPQSNQKGKFLWTHDWRFNEHHMGANTFKPSNAEDILLIGDSIVLGGNPLKEAERLGPSLERKINATVWPISAGSWGMRNEIIYLNSNPDVVQNIDTFVFVWNSGDFDQASSWSCDLTHPLHAPISSLLYVFEKYIFNFEKCTGVIKPEFQVPNGDWHEELKTFIKSPVMKNKKVIAFLYPDINEEANTQLIETRLDNHMNEIYQTGISKVISIGHDPKWGKKYYRDGIHPNSEGNNVLSDIISKYI
jgi:lysophospholipase L1-like esterase